MKKIFFILENLGEGGGGSERVIINLCNELSKTNKNVHIISLTNKGNFYKNKIKKKVNIHILPNKKSFFSIYNLYNFFKKKPPHIVFCTSFHTTVYLIFIKIFILKKFFLISRISTNIYEYFKEHKSLKLKLVYFYYFNFLKFIDKIICPNAGLTNELKRNIKRKYYNKVISINNPVDEKSILEMSKYKMLKNTYSKKKFILTIGRLIPSKDHSTLIRAFKYFLCLNKKNYNDYFLIIIGKGSYFEKLMKLVKKENLQNKIIIIKSVDNPYIFIKKSKLFVLSSKFEGNPNVLLEAQVLKKKIVSTNCKYGPNEILDNGKYGYLVSINNYKDLGLKMYRALKSKNKSITTKEFKKRNSLKLISLKYYNLFKSFDAK